MYIAGSNAAMEGGSKCSNGGIEVERESLYLQSFSPSSFHARPPPLSPPYLVAIAAERDREIGHESTVVLVSNWSPPLLHEYLGPVQPSKHIPVHLSWLELTACLDTRDETVTYTCLNITLVDVQYSTVPHF